MPNVSDAIASLRDDILARLPDPKAEGAGDNADPTPAPAPATDPDPNAADPADAETRIAALEAKVADLETRLKALEDAAAPAAQDPAPDPEETPAALRKLRALLENPIVIQALAAGEKRDRNAAPAPDAAPNLRAAYAALTDDHARADFIKAHWADRRSFLA